MTSRRKAKARGRRRSNYYLRCVKVGGTAPLFRRMYLRLPNGKRLWLWGWRR